jgi:rhomboid family GlyGly-CTERM serine protease
MRINQPPFNIIFKFALPLIIALFVVGLSLGGESATLLLRFERVGIQNGEIWRLLTANFVHLGWSHALLNIAGLVLIWLLFGQRFNQTGWSIILISSLLGTTLGLLFFNPTLTWYVGLSGALHGLFIAGCVAEIKLKYRMGIVLLVILAGKILWEQFQGPLPGTSDAAGGPVIVDAHLYGALAGFAALFLKPKPLNQDH